MPTTIESPMCRTTITIRDGALPPRGQVILRRDLPQSWVHSSQAWNLHPADNRGRQYVAPPRSLRRCRMHNIALGEDNGHAVVDTLIVEAVMSVLGLLDSIAPAWHCPQCAVSGRPLALKSVVQKVADVAPFQQFRPPDLEACFAARQAGAPSPDAASERLSDLGVEFGQALATRFRRPSGFGRLDVELTFDPRRSMSERLATMNRRWQEVLAAFAQYSTADIPKQDVFTLTLRSKAIPSPRDALMATLRLPEPLVRARLLHHVVEYTTSPLDEQVARHEAAPPPIFEMLEAGSCFIFESPFSHRPELIAALQQLEQNGIGDGVRLGFGEVSVCDGLHLLFRPGAPHTMPTRPIWRIEEPKAPTQHPPMSLPTRAMVAAGPMLWRALQELIDSLNANGLVISLDATTWRKGKPYMRNRGRLIGAGFELLWRAAPGADGALNVTWIGRSGAPPEGLERLEADWELMPTPPMDVRSIEGSRLVAQLLTLDGRPKLFTLQLIREA